MTLSLSCSVRFGVHPSRAHLSTASTLPSVCVPALSVPGSLFQHDSLLEKKSRKILSCLRVFVSLPHCSPRGSEDVLTVHIKED